MKNATTLVSMVLIATAAVASIAFQRPAYADTTGECQKVLNTELSSAGCWDKNKNQVHCSGSVYCCTHYHDSITWNSLDDAGAETGKKWKSVSKKWRKHDSEECGDHDEDSSTPNTCKLPSMAGWVSCQTNFPEHFVYNHALEDCDN